MKRRFAVMLGLVWIALLSLVPLATAAGEQANGAFVDSTGTAIGQVTLEQLADNSVKVSVALKDTSVVKAGLHGIHFHAVGRCDGPDFASAGGHFNPASKQHGTKNPQGPHAGDLSNLPIDATTATQGGYAATMTTTSITLAAGTTNIFDSDGTALVIHANVDDETTDPTGNSGGRVACAVLQRVAAPGLPNTGAGGGRPVAPLLLLIGVMATGIHIALLRRRAI